MSRPRCGGSQLVLSPSLCLLIGDSPSGPLLGEAFEPFWEALSADCLKRECRYTEHLSSPF